MFHKIKCVCPIDNYCLIVIFSEGIIKKYDIKPLFEKYEIFKNLKSNDLFEKVVVGPGGYGIIWNDDIDLSCEELFDNGTLISDK